jgi:signal transduction histidine kinase
MIAAPAPPSTPLDAANQLMTRVGTILTLRDLMPALVSAVATLTNAERATLLLVDDNAVLQAHAMSGDQALSSARLRTLAFSTYNRDADPMIAAWKRGASYRSIVQPTSETPETDAEKADNAHTTQFVFLADDLILALQLAPFVSAPLMRGETWIGALLIDAPTDKTQPDDTAAAILSALAPVAVITLENARLYTQTKTELQATNDELKILSQIDRELSDTIILDHVFDMTLDWSIRYTNAQAALLALYDADKDELRITRDLGYTMTSEVIAQLQDADGGIAHRVARTERAEIIPDVSTDPDYVMLAVNMRSHMSVPVLRQEKVIAVISVETKRLNGFSEDHQRFVEKLAVRAGVAIDNARLFADSVREREKLTHILSSVADVVIVVGYDDRLILVNQSAISAFRLYTDRIYIDESFGRIFGETTLHPVYQQAKHSQHTLSQEIKIGQRTYFASLSVLERIGWIIVMHDITPLKETEQLKSELLATVSHDLKQPLSIMNGYIELMQIQRRLDEVGMNYSNIVLRSIENMRRLIDDLLDFAKIETGIQIKPRAVRIGNVIDDCLQSIRPLAALKAMVIQSEIGSDLPVVAGDADRLHQIFNNLISNAVKYTPPEGRVRIWAERRTMGLCIAVQDTGIGISPEDQARIFDRFFRVRRTETETIEGTGLGLAIVKRLVELHSGQIGVESRLGEGTTFYVTLPIYQPDPTPISALPVPSES